MSKPYKGFEPKWCLKKAPEKSYRSIFKWGDPEEYKVPKETLYKMLKSTFKLDDDYFSSYKENLGLEEVKDLPKTKLTDKQIKELEDIVGKENVSQIGRAHV